MSQKKIKQYSPEFKLKVVLEVLREEQSINGLIPPFFRNYARSIIDPLSQWVISIAQI